MKKLLIALIFVSINNSGLWCTNDDSPDRSILILFDLSHSMELKDQETGKQRLDQALNMAVSITKNPLETTLRTGLRLIFWIFLITFFILCTVFLKSVLKWRAGVLKARIPVKKMYFLKLHIRRLTDGKDIMCNFDYLPVTVGPSSRADVLLPTKNRLQFTIDLKNEEPYFSSRSMIIINGVARREKRLKKDDYLLFGKYRVFFRGLSIAETPRYVHPKPSFVFQLPALIVFFALALAAGVPRTDVRETLPAITNVMRLPDIKRSKTMIIEPGMRADFFKADILFIHAHPDDESLDFGALMARAYRGGKRTVTILFTDGEAGIDQYPGRRVGENYPAYRLKGSRLAEVRIQEAGHALSILGSEVYIRLGLRNNPYNSLRDVLSLKEVIRRWGGESKNVETLVELLKGFRPDIVISPDDHSDAFEHFEHEAVGYIVKRALTVLRERGHYFVKGHLVSVDPLQKDRYKEVLGINAMERVPYSGLTFRAIQALALKEHITQRDASVVGLERLPNFKYEYYHKIRWAFDQPVQEYFK